VNRKQYNRRSGADGIMGAGHFEETSFVGTWRWNAPEILVDADHCTYSRATDMYSFGMCLWEIYSDGDIPFAEIKFDFEVRQKVLNNQRPMIRPSSKCPEQFVELITCCWSQDPKIRPSAVRASQILKNILDSMDVPNDTPTRGYNSIGSFFTGSFLTNVGGRSTNGSAINSRVSTFLSNFSFLSSGNRSDSDRETSQKFFTGNESRSPSTNNIRGTNNRRRFPMLKTLSEFHDVESQFSPNSSSSSTSETISPSTKTPYVGTILEANEKAYESGSINEDIPVLQENQEKIVVTERKLSASKTLTYI
jgi:serine/threonine protein kinase